MCGPGHLHHRSQLRAAGCSDPDVRHLLRVGGLTPAHRGVYLRGAPPKDPLARHALAARAAMSCLSGDAVASHVTAAVLHGLPVWGIALDRVHVTRHRRSGGRVGARLRVHTAALEPTEIVDRFGVRTTCLARTVVDLARSVPFEQAVAVADAALRDPDRRARRRTTAPLSSEALAAALARAARWPGSPAARQVVAFADGCSDSVGESRSRVAIAQAGLPAPVLQWEVRDAAGDFIGFVDFGWPRLRTVGEFDGRVRYSGRLRAGQDPADAVYREKRREDRLRDHGLSVVRWGWTDLADFAPVADRLRARYRR